MQSSLLVAGAALALYVPGPASQEPSADAEPRNEIWLLDAQRPDGSWSAANVPSGLPGVHPGTSSEDLWVTSLATLALLGDGSTSEVGKDVDRVRAALSWIVSLQRADGRLVAPGSATDLLDQGLATLALTEDLVLSGGSPADGPAARALAYLESRALESGGWNREGSAVGAPDPRTTAWAAMAVASGRDAGLAGEADRLTLSAAALAVFNADRGRVAPRDHASELLVRMLAGESPDSPAFSASARRLLESPLPSSADGADYDPELVYLQSLVAFRAGGELWKAWAKRMRRMQTDLGHVGTGGPLRLLVCDPGLTRGGSVAAAGFSTLSLEVCFRYARIIGSR